MVGRGVERWGTGRAGTKGERQYPADARQNSQIAIGKMTVLTSGLDPKMQATCRPITPDPDDKTLWRFLKKIFLSQVFRSARKTRESLRRESFFLSTTSLEKRRPSEQSVDTVITLLEEMDNRLNEKIERG